MIFDKFLAAFYYFFSSIPNNTNARYRAKLCILLFQGVCIFFPIIIVQNFYGLLILSPDKRFSKFYFLPFIILWMIGVELYYNKKRSITLLSAFYNKPDKYKLLWLRLSWAVLLIPLFTLVIVAIKQTNYFLSYKLMP